MAISASESERDEQRRARIEQLGREVARPASRDVDQAARFPRESLEALRALGALGASVPQALGGAGASLSALARDCLALGQHCASSAMVLAMHHIQVLSIANHRGASRELGAYLSRVASEQRLIASATSEVGPSGDMRKSIVAVEDREPGFGLEKKASVLSYGAYADDLLISARRNPEAAPSDQVLVLALRGSYELSNLGSWDTLGMRGTCSPGATVKAWGERWQIVPEPFGEIAGATMVPVSHTLWGATWLGIATDAVHIAQTMVRARARKEPGTTPRSAQKLAETLIKLQLWRSELFAFAAEHDALTATGDRELLLSVSMALRANNLKLASSRLVVELVSDAIGICGVESYRNDSPNSLGRHLRDSHSAALMVHNDRIAQTNEALLLVHKGT